MVILIFPITFVIQLSMTSFNGRIYLTTNLINRKIYIGQTTNDKNSYIGSGIAIKKAIKKYGKCNFSRVILMKDITSIKELNFWEEFYINLFNSRNSKIGYNMKAGGRNGKFNHTPEAIQKIAIRSNKEDNKLRIREIQKIAVIIRKGSHHSDESKKKIVIGRFGKIKEIDIYKNGELLKTCNLSIEAADFTGVKPSTIRNNLSGLSKSAGGYIFKYKNIA